MPSWPIGKGKAFSVNSHPYRYRRSVIMLKYLHKAQASTTKKDTIGLYEDPSVIGGSLRGRSGLKGYF